MAYGVYARSRWRRKGVWERGAHAAADEAEIKCVLMNLSAFLWARRLNNALSACLRESLAEQDSKLVHR